VDKRQKRKTIVTIFVMTVASIVAIVVSSAVLSLAEDQNDSRQKTVTNIQEASINNKAPNIRLKTIDDRTITLEQFKGKPVILWFMSAWCENCIDSAETLRKIHSTFGQKIEIVTIDIWSAQNLAKLDPSVQKYNLAESEEDLGIFKKTFGGDWHWSLDDDYVLFKYEITVIDSTVVLDQQGTIIFVNRGLIEYETLSAIIEDILNKYADSLPSGQL